jgi:tetratricopeptide (TPR) repeat protein
VTGGQLRRNWWSLAIAAWLLLALDAAGAAAQQSPEAARLFEEGRTLAEQGKYEAACERYAKSYELERAAGTMLNLGDCAEREGQLHQAWVMYDNAARAYDSAGKAGPAKFARDRANVLAPKLATVVVRIAEPRVGGLTVRIGERAVPPAAEIVERVDEGEVPIAVGAPGRAPFSTTVRAAIGEQVIIEVPALRAIDRGRPDASPAPRPPVDRPTPTRRQRGRVLLAAGITGAGVLSLGASGVLGLAAKRRYDSAVNTVDSMGTPVCEPDGGRVSCYDAAVHARARSALDLARYGDVAGIAGAALIAGGVILYVTAPRERVTVAPVASPSSVGLAASVRF